MSDYEFESVEFERGTILKYKGFPFECPDDVVLLGLNSNKKLADRLDGLRAIDNRRPIADVFDDD